jgi:hypothetical protein
MQSAVNALCGLLGLREVTKAFPRKALDQVSLHSSGHVFFGYGQSQTMPVLIIAPCEKKKLALSCLNVRRAEDPAIIGCQEQALRWPEFHNRGRGSACLEKAAN